MGGGTFRLQRGLWQCLETCLLLWLEEVLRASSRERSRMLCNLHDLKSNSDQQRGKGIIPSLTEFKLQVPERKNKVAWT